VPDGIVLGVREDNPWKGTVMSKVTDVGVLDAAEVAADPGVPESVRVALHDIAATAREGLLALSVSVGLAVMSEMMQAEVTARVGPKHARLAERTARRHAATDTSVVLGGRKVAVRRPRARTLDGQEVALESFAAFDDDDQLDSLVFERMLAGLATRRHRAANEPVGEAVEAAARSTSKSAVSRRFVRATARELDELMSRDLSALRVAALMIDGIHFAQHCCVVALAISVDGTKTPVGLWLGDTENKRVATDLLAEPRGPRADRGRRPAGRHRRRQGAARRSRQRVRRPGAGATLHLAQAPQRHRLPAPRPARLRRPQARGGVHRPRPRQGPARRADARSLPGGQAPRRCRVAA